MMMTLLPILLLALLAAADIVLWRCSVRRMGRTWRYTWLTMSAVTWLSLIWMAGFLLLRKAQWMDVDRTMHMALWVVWLFILGAGCKTVYFFFWLAGRALGLRRTCNMAGAAFVIVVAVAMIRGATVGRNHIEVRQVEIASAKLPASFDGLRVAFFSDLHLGNLMSKQRLLDELVGKINDAQPDIVCFGGDMVNLSSRELTIPVVHTLGRVRARHGVYAVLGNHDLGIYGDSVAHPYALNVVEVLAAYGQMEWTTLINETLYISIGADSIALSGVGYPVSERHPGLEAGDIYDADPAAAYSNLPDSVYNITLSHTPVLWPDQLPQADLTLSGHTHAMQAKLTLFGVAFSPARLRYRHWSGLYTEGSRNLYVNDGTGYVMYPMRIGTRPELTLITLRSR